MAKKARESSVQESAIRLKLEGQVTLTRLNHALDAWTDFLREVGRSVAGGPTRDPLRFVITEAKGGSVTLTARPQPARREISAAVARRIATTVTSGIRTLQRSAKRPKYFSETALIRLRELALLTGPETQSIKVSNGSGDPLALSARLVTHVEAVLAPVLESIGTVEGNLEGLIIHGKRRFLIFDPITGHQVTCYFGPRVRWEAVLASFGKRVAVSGFIKSRTSGEKVSIIANSLHTFLPEEELPKADRVLGSIKAIR